MVEVQRTSGGTLLGDESVMFLRMHSAWSSRSSSSSKRRGSAAHSLAALHGIDNLGSVTSQYTRAKGSVERHARKQFRSEEGHVSADVRAVLEMRRDQVRQ